MRLGAQTNTVTVKFRISHRFDWPSRTVNFRVDPIDMEPHWLPKVLHPAHCESVPFALGDACNVSMADACVQKAYADDDIEALDLLWEPGQDVIAARELLNTGFFTQTFTWEEARFS